MNIFWLFVQYFFCTLCGLSAPPMIDPRNHPENAGEKDVYRMNDQNKNQQNSNQEKSQNKNQNKNQQQNSQNKKQQNQNSQNQQN